MIQLEEVDSCSTYIINFVANSTTYEKVRASIRADRNIFLVYNIHYHQYLGIFVFFFEKKTVTRSSEHVNYLYKCLLLKIRIIRISSKYSHLLPLKCFYMKFYSLISSCLSKSDSFLFQDSAGQNRGLANKQQLLIEEIVNQEIDKLSSQ